MLPEIERLADPWLIRQRRRLALLIPVARLAAVGTRHFDAVLLNAVLALEVGRVVEETGAVNERMPPDLVLRQLAVVDADCVELGLRIVVADRSAAVRGAARVLRIRGLRKRHRLALEEAAAAGHPRNGGERVAVGDRLAAEKAVDETVNVILAEVTFVLRIGHEVPDATVHALAAVITCKEPVVELKVRLVPDVVPRGLLRPADANLDCHRADRRRRRHAAKGPPGPNRHTLLADGVARTGV